ncbi:MAG: molybdopterin-dependent oxidoreductase [Actinomycetota bacterium]|nr:molybdopterin-dependent oxidoreductase [Actinomycetota bacterium]
MTTVARGVAFRLNGSEVSASVEHPHLLAALRDELGIASAKDGCAPSGQCGCCTVLVDGKATISCQMSMAKAAGREVVTLEGFDLAERDRFARAFASTGALQCGFCTPGIVVRTKSLLAQKGNDLDRATIQSRLGAHLCRCTGYTKIVEAIELLASGDPIPEPALPGGIGKDGAKYEGLKLALGDRGFIDDFRIEGLLHGALRLTDHARADVLDIDSSKALAVPGVVAVFTAQDVPGELKVGLIHKDWPIFIPVGGRTSYTGDVLAMVVAEDVRIAQKAAAMVEVEYKVLPAISDPVAALESEEDAVWGLTGNRLSTSAYKRGDFEASFAASAFTLHEVFETQRVEHAFLEPESTLAIPYGDAELYVYSGGQGVWDDRDQIAAALGIEKVRVTVELVSNGGAFGGKEDLANQAQTALAAFLLDRPVKCTLTREQSFHVHAKRHPIRMEIWAGCARDGMLTAFKARMIGDSGPYASVGMKVLERAAGHATGPYQVPAVDVESIAVRTNNSVGGAFRGFGANQAQFAMEGVIDRLAEKAGIDPWQMRLRNVIIPGSIWGPGQIMDDGCLGAGLCLEAIKPHYDKALADGKAVGLGLGLKNAGLGNGFKEWAKAVVRFEADGTVEVRHCWTEMGQGIHTVALQVAVEELGIDPNQVKVAVDTSRELGTGQTTGSRGTLMGAGAVADACRVAKEDGCQVGIDYMGEYRVDWTNSLSEGLENPVIHSTFSYAAQLVIANRETGLIEKVVAAHDVGRAVNPILCEGQIEGSVHMGLGYALSEDFPCDKEGRPTNMTLRSLEIIRPKDMPPVEVILIESPQPNAPYGIKGVGEIGLVPTAGAVASAYHSLDGIWRNRLPINKHQPLSR